MLNSIAAFHLRGFTYGTLDGTYGNDAAYTRWRRDVRSGGVADLFGTAHDCLTPVYGPARLNRLYLSLCGSVGLTAFSLPHSKKIAPTLR
jgi:hypothetical protein